MIKYLNLSLGDILLDEAAENYLYYGISPGSFFRAVLEDNLFEAATRADSGNFRGLALIATKVKCFFPPESYGSAQIVKEWLTDHNGVRYTWHAHAKKKFLTDCLSGKIGNEKEQEYPF